MIKLKRYDARMMLAVALVMFGGLSCVNDPLVAEPVTNPQTTDAAAPPPRFRDGSVHDPSVIRVGDTFYVFGSHLGAAKSDDLMQWDVIASGVSPANPLFDNVVEELSETFEWAQSNTLWAADVVQLKDGRFYMYYNASKGDSPRSALGIAVADRVDGPYKDTGILLKSGMWGQPGEDGTIYDARLHPNTVDPHVFYDHEGQLWMVYGSYSGGIFILKMDNATGKPLPGQGYGKKLTGGNHSRIEGAYILYHPQTKYYYMFLSFGGLAADGGYNIRVARSERADGPYLDAAGNDMINVKSDPAKPLFDDLSIEPYGVKLMGNFLFERELGEPGAGIGFGYVSPGHNSAYYDSATGKQFLIFHTRFPRRGEGHQIRVHQMFLNRDGWPVVAPYRYTGETAGAIEPEAVAGDYKFVNHGKAISAAITPSQDIRLEPDGKVTGAIGGNWKHSGANEISLDIGGQQYNGVLARLWEPESQRYALTFSALSSQGVAIWGSRMAAKTDAEIVADVQRELEVGDTNRVVENLPLPLQGTRQSRIQWLSSNPQVVTNEGVVTRPAAGAGNATATLTATITQGATTATKTFAVVVQQQAPGGLIAHYAFDGNLNDSSGQAAAGSTTGPRIDSMGGAITFAPGVHGDAAVFDGASGIRLPDGLLAGRTYAVALWLKSTQLTPLSPAFFGARDRDNWISLLPRGHDAANNDTMLWAGTAWYDANTRRKIPVNEWTHLAIAVRNGAATVYINGERRFRGADFPHVFTTPAGTFALGVNWWDTPFQGLMDDLRIYEHALTAEEVAALARKTP